MAVVPAVAFFESQFASMKGSGGAICQPEAALTPERSEHDRIAGMLERAKHARINGDYNPGSNSLEGSNGMSLFIQHWFQVGESGSNLRTELLGGLTTFLTMVYIVFVNPAVLSGAGMDFGAVTTATCLAAALAFRRVAPLIRHNKETGGETT